MEVSGRWRHRFLQIVLLGSLLYALLTLGWFLFNLHQTTPVELAGVFAPVVDGIHEIKTKVVEGRHTSSPEQIEAETHARTVRNLPSGDMQRRNLTCIGWRNTGNCNPDGPREVANDLPCDARIGIGKSGYCEVQDVETGERFRVMRRTCMRYKKAHDFRCSDAPDFVRYHIDALEAVKPALDPTFTLPNIHKHDHGQDGIVLVVYPGLLNSAYAIIRTLRDIVNCTLPIEVWYRQDELQHVPHALRPLQQLAQNDTVGGIIFQEITDPHATHFRAKVYALYHSSFERVLFLDSDNVPVRDPTYLFQSLEFQQTGAIFWPDYWHPRYTIFTLWGESILWELLDMPYVDMFEQESGQLLIDRRQHAAPLELVRFYSFRTPNPIEKLRLLWGDKDLFRMAWIKLDVPFHMIQTPPGVAGKVNGSSFCGMTMVQHDPQGEMLFLHRNANKLTGEVRYTPSSVKEATERVTAQLKKQELRRLPSKEEVANELKRMEKTKPEVRKPLEADGMPDPIIWTHLLSFQKSRVCSVYRVEPFRAAPDFPKTQSCYGKRDIVRSGCFKVQLFANMSFAGLETHVRRFAMEAAAISKFQL